MNPILAKCSDILYRMLNGEHIPLRERLYLLYHIRYYGAAVMLAVSKISVEIETRER